MPHDRHPACMQQSTCHHSPFSDAVRIWLVSGARARAPAGAPEFELHAYAGGGFEVHAYSTSKLRMHFARSTHNVF